MNSIIEKPYFKEIAFVFGVVLLLGAWKVAIEKE